MKKLSVVLILTLMMTLLSVFNIGVLADDTVRGVWLCTVKNLDFPSRPGLTSASLKAELDSFVASCKETSVNTIFFQVRPNSDALYNSEIFPWSDVLTGIQGKAPDGGFDPLSYIIKKAHAADIELHAWINPYRIGTGGEANALGALSPSNPAVTHPEYRVTCSDGGVYYNPALPEVRKLITDGVIEIIENYDVDGIHFDDYFYPYNVTDYPDAEDFKKYGAAFDNIADFRRNNVNLLVEAVSKAVKNHSSDIKFGISPFGIWDNKRDNPLGSDTTGMSSYSSIFADSRAWVQNGWLDYICPQLYWSFENPKAPFDKIADWWNALCKKNDTDLYIGHALYKMGTGEVGWNDPNQIDRQLEYTKKLSAVKGNVIFRAGLLDKDPVTVVETPPLKSDSVKITGPVNGFKTTDAAASVTGVANPAYPLTVNGKAVQMTEHGYFSTYVKLSLGKNTFTFRNGDSISSISITRTRVTPKDNTVNTVFEKDSAYPFGDSELFCGERVTLRIRALDGCEVYATLDDKEYKLTAGEKADGFTDYTAHVTLPNLFAHAKTAGKLTFRATLNGKDYLYEAADVEIISRPMTLFTLNECYVYDSVNGGSMMDNYQLPAGAVLTATACVGDRYRLVSGKWIGKDNVSFDRPGTKDSFSVDASGYTAIKLDFSSPPTFVSYVNNDGTLVLELFGGNEPSFEKQDSVKTDVIKRGLDFIVTFKKKVPITGYYITQSSSSLTVYIYNETPSLSGKTIVLDAGHGGDDPGALGPAGADGVCEADLNLALTYTLKRKLEEKGANVYLTRFDDSTLLLDKRASLVRSHSPDVSISLHCNSVARSSDFNKSSGTLILYSRETAKPLADALEKHISQNLGVKSEGARTQSLNVCRDYRYPCVLIECGYVCNPAEYERLLTDSYKDTLCDNIVNALSEYFA